VAYGSTVSMQHALYAIRIAGEADVMATDLLLPGALDGCALIERLKSDPLTRTIPIIVLTVCASTTEEVQAGRAGCDVFLSKPCLPQTLLGHIRRMMAPRVVPHPAERSQVIRGRY